MDRLILLLLAIIVIFSVLAYFIWRIARGRKAITYLPAIICLALSIYNYYLARTGAAEGFRSLAGAIYAMMFFAAFIAALVTVLILDYRKRTR